MAMAAGMEISQAMDDADELLNAHLSDEEILNAFLKDGCDLDGTPLPMWKEEHLHLPHTYRPDLLH
jgi:hypothetical protein